MTAGVLAIFVGLMAEQWAVDSQIEVLQRTELAGCPVTLGSVGRKPVLVCRTGLGDRRGRAAAEAVLSEHAPSAGGAARGLPPRAGQGPRGASLRYTLGDVLTLWRAAADPLSRERAMKLGEMTVVDAGGYVVAEAGRDKGVPFLAVRVSLGRVIDVASESLSLVADRGHLRPGRAALHYLPRPHKAPAFIRLAVGGRKGTR